MKQYFWNLAIAIDQLLNTIACGDPDETVSSRVGKIRRTYDGVLPWYLRWAIILEWLDPNHLNKTQEHDEGSKGVHNGY